MNHIFKQNTIFFKFHTQANFRQTKTKYQISFQQNLYRIFATFIYFFSNFSFDYHHSRRIIYFLCSIIFCINILGDTYKVLIWFECKWKNHPLRVIETEAWMSFHICFQKLCDKKFTLIYSYCRFFLLFFLSQVFDILPLNLCYWHSHSVFNKLLFCIGTG